MRWVGGTLQEVARGVEKARIFLCLSFRPVLRLQAKRGGGVEEGDYERERERERWACIFD